MLLLISPAKTFTQRKRLAAHFTHTRARFQSEAERIIAQSLRLSAEELGRALGLSPKLSEEVYRRQRSFFDEGTPEQQALLSYSGMVYRKLDAPTLSAGEWHYATEHLLMTSFAYGLLRPSDLIRPYRMEGTVRLPEIGEGRLFDYWRDLLTPVLIERGQACGGTLLFLASDEMRGLFHWEEVRRALRVITPSFYVRRPDGGLKQIVVYTKMARGTMAGTLLRQPTEDLAAVQALQPEGFVYSPAESTADEWVYVLES